MTRPWSIAHGDAIEVLNGLEAGCADAVVMDPPFTVAGGSTNGRSSGSAEADAQFFVYWLRDVLSAVQRVVRPDGCGFIFCDWRTLGPVQAAMRSKAGEQRFGWSLSQALVWDRMSIGMGAPFRNQFEMIAFIRGPDYDRADLPRNIGTVLQCRWPYGEHENHHAEKPVPLARDLVRWATWGNPDALVVDPFAGSGTVGVACAAEGRAYFGVEHDEHEYAAACRRVEAAFMCPAGLPVRERMQTRLFGAP